MSMKARKKLIEDAVRSAGPGLSLVGRLKIESAVRTATTVILTEGAVEAFGASWDEVDKLSARGRGDRRRAGLTAALRELGFEVLP